MKTLPAGMYAALEQSRVVMVVAVDIDTDGTEGGMIRVHNAIGTLKIPAVTGDDYVGVGELGALDVIEKDGSSSPEGLSLKLSGIDITFLEDVINGGYQGRPVNVYMVVLSLDYSTQYEHQIFSGKVDTMNIKLGKTAEVTCKVENRLIAWKTSNISRWNEKDHWRNAPETDRFFQYVESVSSKELALDPYIAENDLR